MLNTALEFDCADPAISLVLTRKCAELRYRALTVQRHMHNEVIRRCDLNIYCGYMGLKTWFLCVHLHTKFVRIKNQIRFIICATTAALPLTLERRKIYILQLKSANGKTPTYITMSDRSSSCPHMQTHACS